MIFASDSCFVKGSGILQLMRINSDRVNKRPASYDTPCAVDKLIISVSAILDRHARHL